MQLPLQITFRDMEPSEAVEANIRERASRLDRFYNHIMSCRVMVEAPHAHHNKGRLFQVRIDVTVPDGELNVNHGHHHKDHSHEDIYVAIREATPAHGRVLAMASDDDYGRIETPDNRVIYFHRNSVLNAGFDKLDVGSEVRFVEEMGELGPQASTVALVGKHHVVE